MSIEIAEATTEQLARAAIKFKGSEDAGAYTSTGQGLAFVARDGEDIVGWCWGYSLVRPDGQRMVYLHELEVDPGARRQGVGRRLIEESLARAAFDKAKKLFLVTNRSNTAARELYESCGGQIADGGDSVLYSWDPANREGW